MFPLLRPIFWKKRFSHFLEVRQLPVNLTCFFSPKCLCDGFLRWGLITTPNQFDPKQFNENWVYIGFGQKFPEIGVYQPGVSHHLYPTYIESHLGHLLELMLLFPHLLKLRKRPGGHPVFLGACPKLYEVTSMFQGSFIWFHGHVV